MTRPFSNSSGLGVGHYFSQIPKKKSVEQPPASLSETNEFLEIVSRTTGEIMYLPWAGTPAAVLLQSSTCPSMPLVLPSWGSFPMTQHSIRPWYRPVRDFSRREYTLAVLAEFLYLSHESAGNTCSSLAMSRACGDIDVGVWKRLAKKSKHHRVSAKQVFVQRRSAGDGGYFTGLHWRWKLTHSVTFERVRWRFPVVNAVVSTDSNEPATAADSNWVGKAVDLTIVTPSRPAVSAPTGGFRHCH